MTIDLKKHWDAVAFDPPLGWSGNHEFTAEKSGHKIRYAYAPSVGEHRGTVVLTHGYGEHLDLYFESVKEYQKMGFSVWAMDWHGHGLSGRDDDGTPETPSVNDLKESVDDLHEFATRIVQRDPAKPYILSTHSMGGGISARYLQVHQDTFSAAILSAPMLDIFRANLPREMRPLVHAAFKTAEWLGFGDTAVPRVSDLTLTLNKLVAGFKTTVNPESRTLRRQYNDAVRAQNIDAQIQWPTFGWISAAFNISNEIMRADRLKAIKTPVLIGSAGKEDLVDNDALEIAARMIPEATLIKLPDARHGLWFESDDNFNKWMGSIRAFLNDTLTGPEGSPARKEPTSLPLARTVAPAATLIPVTA